MKAERLTRGVFVHPEFDDHEHVVFCFDADTGLKAIIAIHDTTLGPALGGCRRWAYESEADALTDVLRLSAGMTLKNAISGLDSGGGKAVILAEKGTDISPEQLRAFGKKVDTLGGRYVTAEDVGIRQSDMDIVSEVTAHVRGTSKDGFGDPSPFTAYGVYCGIKAAVRHRLGAASLDGLTIAVQGVGQVGAGVARLAAKDGATLILGDIRKDAVAALAEEIGAEAADPETLHALGADVFCPCALGAILNAETIPELTAPIVAGAANNQLETAEDGKRLAEMGVLYAPDFVINGGGVISIAEAELYTTIDAMNARVARIGDTLATVFTRAETESRPTAAIAVAIAEERLATARH